MFSRYQKLKGGCHISKVNRCVVRNQAYRRGELTKAIGGRTMSFSRGLKAKAAKVWEDG